MPQLQFLLIREEGIFSKLTAVAAAGCTPRLSSPQRVPNNYETDLIFPIVSAAAALAGINYHAADEATKTALKVIGDHTRAVAYLLSDGVVPSNVGRGYVVRRLLRRVVMKGRLLGIEKLFTAECAKVAVELSGGCDPQVRGGGHQVLLMQQLWCSATPGYWIVLTMFLAAKRQPTGPGFRALAAQVHSSASHRIHQQHRWCRSMPWESSGT